MNRILRYLPNFVMAFIGIAVLSMPNPAQAVFQMRISWTSGGGGSILVSDGGGGDLNGAAGVILWSGTAGNVAINVNTGLSYPASGTPAFPDMDINFVANKFTGSGAEVLTIEISDIGFTTSPLDVVSQIGGTFSGAFSQTTAQFFSDASNVQFGTSNASSLQTFNSSPFSGTNLLAVTGATPYSLTQRIVLTAGAGSGGASGDFQIMATPAPAGLVLALSGSPIVGIAAWLRRRRVLVEA